MANEEHAKILMQGILSWNRWREDNPDIRPDLSDMRLIGVDLCHTNLSHVDLIDARLNGSQFIGANLSYADLVGANLSDANLSDSNLTNANLRNAILNNVILVCTNLRGVDLRASIISDAYLYKTDFTNAKVAWTKFNNLNLTQIKGLDTIKHYGPSSVGVDTIYLSKGNISEGFLRGAGVPNNLTTFMASLVGKAFDFYSCFISYSSKDQAFADRLYADLQSKGVRCWFAPEDLKIGDRFQERIEDSIRVYDKLLIILSEESISSRWVEREVNAAFEHEGKQNRTMLFPIRIDDAVMGCNQAWAADIRRSRHIGDFTGWKDHDSYQKAFARLMRALKAENS